MTKKFFILVMTLATLSGCTGRKKTKKPVLETPRTQEFPPTGVTVFVHGIRLANFLQRMPIFKYSFYCPQGLTLAKDLDTKYTLSNLQELYKTDPEQFNKETVYLFGWPGCPSFDARYKAAQDLYQELLKLRKKYPNLPITVFGQSHGGNVVLNLARVAEEHPQETLQVDRLIITASPVQAATAQYVHSPFFKEIYVFYSDADFLQIIDPQGLHKHQARDSYLKASSFSKTRFPSDPKLYQSLVRINGRKAGHSAFIYKPFLRKLPSLLRTLSTPEGRATLPHVKGCPHNDFIIRIKT